MKTNRNFFFIFLSIVIFFTIVLYSTNKRTIKMAGVTNNSKILKARVIGTEHSGNRNNSLKIIVKYEYLNTEYETEEVKYQLETYTPVINKEFPIIIDSLNVSNSYILVSPSDFNRFNISFPDSLNWIKKYIRD